MKMSPHLKKFSFSLSAVACFLTTVSTVHGFDDADIAPVSNVRQPIVPTVPQPRLEELAESIALAPREDGYRGAEEGLGGGVSERPDYRILQGLAESIVENVENSSDVYNQINGEFKHNELGSFRKTYSAIKKVSSEYGSYFDTRSFCLKLNEQKLLEKEFLEKITGFFECRVKIQKSILEFAKSYEEYEGFESLELAKALGLKKEEYEAAFEQLESIKGFNELQGDDVGREKAVKTILDPIFQNFRLSKEKFIQEITEKLDVYAHCHGMVNRVLGFVQQRVKQKKSDVLESLDDFPDFYIFDEKFVEALYSITSEVKTFDALNDSLAGYQQENGSGESLALTAQSITGRVLRNSIFPLIAEEKLNADDFAMFFHKLLFFIQMKEVFLEDKTPYEKDKYLDAFKGLPFYDIAQKDFLSIYGRFLSKIQEYRFEKNVREDYEEFLKAKSAK